MADKEKIQEINTGVSAKDAAKPGDMLDDGTVYAGISPDTGEALHVMPQDAPKTLALKDAMGYAAGLNAAGHAGHNDWRLPTRNELNVLFENRHNGALKDTFNATSDDAAHWYWSCTDDPHDSATAYIQSLTTGRDDWLLKNYGELSVRCVRAAPKP